MNFYPALALTFLFVFISIRIFNILWLYFFQKPKNLRKEAGASWAVVTGATDGIGQAYAFELAVRGFNVFLVSRTQSKLDQTKAEILQKHPNILVKTAQFDFKTSSSEDYKKLLKILNQVEIGMLVNNVGVFYDVPNELHHVGVDYLADMVVVDTLPPTLLTAGILPQMLLRNQGIIVNIGSTAGCLHLPLMAAYSASKKYVEWLTDTLRMEYKNTDLIFQNIVPLMVATKMAGIREPSFFVPDATTFAKSALDTIGYANQTTGYITHQLQFEVIRFVPGMLIDWAVTKRNEASRERILKKRRRQKRE